MVQVDAKWAEPFSGEGIAYEIECPDCGIRVQWNPALDYQDLTCNCHHGWRGPNHPRRWDFYVVAHSYSVEEK